MMAHLCEVCKKVIEQEDDEFLHIWIMVKDTTQSDEQDTKSQAYGDFCDGCIADGSAVEYLLKELEWTLAPRARDNVSVQNKK